jgi:AP-3 complex subunit mu
VSVHPSLGPSGADFEVRLQLNPRFTGKSADPNPGPRSGLGRASSGTTSAPAIEEMVVHVPLPAGVKNMTDLRVLKGNGDAGYAPGDGSIEWRVSSREISTLMAQDRGGGVGATATLRGTVVGQEDDVAEHEPVTLATSTYDYDDDNAASSVPRVSAKPKPKTGAASSVLMPSCATVSFSVKGWLASGIRVESLNLDVKRSKGLGSGVTPYKGVKYLCVSRKGVEARC